MGIVWKLTRDAMDSGSGGSYGIPQKRLHGHGHFVSDVVLSSDGHFALSGSWNKTLRLWDLKSKNQVEELKPEVAGNGDPPQCLSMAWSADGQTLFAGYSDNQIRVWQVSISTR